MTTRKPAAKRQPAKPNPAAEPTPIPKRGDLEGMDKEALIALATEKGIDTTGLLTLELRAKLAEADARHLPH